MTHLPYAHQNMPKQSQTRETEWGWWWGEPDRHSTSAGSVESRIEPTGIYSPNLATETNQQKFFLYNIERFSRYEHKNHLRSLVRRSAIHTVKVTSKWSTINCPFRPSLPGGGRGGITCPRINGCIPRSLRDLSFIHDTRQNLGCSAPDKNKPYTTGFAICRSWMTSVIQ